MQVGQIFDSHQFRQPRRLFWQASKINNQSQSQFRGWICFGHFQVGRGRKGKSLSARDLGGGSLCQFGEVKIGQQAGHKLPVQIFVWG